MGLVLKPGEIKGAAQQMRSGIESNRAGYQNALQVVQRFGENEGLKSESWDQAKQMVYTAHSLIVQAMCTAQNAVEDDLGTLESIVGDEELDEEDLIAKIELLVEECIAYEKAIANLQRIGGRSIIRDYAGIQTAINNYRRMLEITKKELETLREKLEDLRSKSQISADLLQSVENLLQWVDIAIHDAEVCITGRGDLSDGEWQIKIPETISVIEAKDAALKNYLKDELNISLKDFKKMYGEDTVREINEYMKANVSAKPTSKEKQELNQYIIKKACDCSGVAVEGNKYMLLSRNEKKIEDNDYNSYLMYEFKESEIKDVVMNINFANVEVKKDYIAQYLKDELEISDMHLAAIMGNLQAESGFSPLNRQNSDGEENDLYDPEYMDEYDHEDKKGWGLAQWTYYKRKKGLYDFAMNNGEDDINRVGDMDVQLAYLVYELEEDTYINSLYEEFLQKDNLEDATECFMSKIEKPQKDNLSTRIGYARDIYDELVANEGED